MLNGIGLSAVSGRRAGARGLWRRKSRGGWERDGIDMFNLSGSDISRTRGFLRNSSSRELQSNSNVDRPTGAGELSLDGSYFHSHSSCDCRRATGSGHDTTRSTKH